VAGVAGAKGRVSNPLFRKLKPMQSAVDCQRNWTVPATGTLPSLAKLHKNIKGYAQSQLFQPEAMALTGILNPNTNVST
jgi:hypothetical protein